MKSLKEQDIFPGKPEDRLPGLRPVGETGHIPQIGKIPVGECLPKMAENGQSTDSGIEKGDAAF
ncbi:hypothetical protein ABH19_12095 [Leptospirillum sp. Group II 'CF-1']|nr:hypothetical protein ABH19_12095 [Leptospirillum sp. Group II 'CF-1']